MKPIREWVDFYKGDNGLNWTQGEIKNLSRV